MGGDGGEGRGGAAGRGGAVPHRAFALVWFDKWVGIPMHVAATALQLVLMSWIWGEGSPGGDGGGGGTVSSWGSGWDALPLQRSGQTGSNDPPMLLMLLPYAVRIWPYLLLVCASPRRYCWLRQWGAVLAHAMHVACMCAVIGTAGGERPPSAVQQLLDLTVQYDRLHLAVVLPLLLCMSDLVWVMDLAAMQLPVSGMLLWAREKALRRTVAAAASAAAAAAAAGATSATAVAAAPAPDQCGLYGGGLAAAGTAGTVPGAKWGVVGMDESPWGWMLRHMVSCPLVLTVGPVGVAVLLHRLCSWVVGAAERKVRAAEAEAAAAAQRKAAKQDA